jgi:ferredoxin
VSDLRVRIDRELCIGAENCMRYAPNTFETDAQGKSVLRAGPHDPDDTVRMAVTSCPVGALSVEEDADGGAPGAGGS